MLLMIAMLLMTVVSGQSGFRHQDHPGPKRSSEHQRGNRLDRAHCNLLFVLVALQDINVARDIGRIIPLDTRKLFNLRYGRSLRPLQ
jgi:hypothetical protein